jgi:hypothetical protein
MVAPVSGGAGDADVAQLGLKHSELDHLGWLNGDNYTLIAGTLNTLAGILHAFPDSIVGWSPGEADEIQFGGSNMGAAVSAIGSLFNTLASNASFQGGRSATVAGYQRRFDEWAFQSNLAAKELEQIDRQIAAAEIRVAMAEQELKNHDQQIKNAKDIDQLMHDKFSNQQLYQWMPTERDALLPRLPARVRTRQAPEHAYRYELGLTDSKFVLSATGTACTRVSWRASSFSSTRDAWSRTISTRTAASSRSPSKYRCASSTQRRLSPCGRPANASSSFPSGCSIWIFPATTSGASRASPSPCPASSDRTRP